VAISVPVVNNNTIRTERAPDQRQDASAATPEAFGAGIGRAMQGVAGAIGQVGDTFAAEAAREKEIGEAGKVLDATNKLQDGLRQNMAVEGAKQGLDTIGGTGRTDAFIKAQVEQLSQGITDPKTRLAFDRVASTARDGQLDAMQRRETQAKTQAVVEIAKTTLDNTKQAAIDAANDDKIADAQMKVGLAAIAANPTGQPKEVLDAQMKAYTSDVQTARIQRIGVASPAAAAEMYERLKPQIVGADHVKIEKILDPLRDRTIGVGVGQEYVGQPGPQVSQLAQVAATTMQQMPPPGIKPVSANVGGVDLARLTTATASQESSGNPNAVSPKGAAGLLQVMPSTARDISKRLGDGLITDGMSDAQVREAMKNPETGVRYGATYLHDQLQRYGGDIPAALVAYNAGPAVADAWLKSRKGPGDLSGLPAETQAYVPKVMSRYGDVQGGGPADVGGQATAINQIRMGATPQPGAKMTAENWSLKFYKPEDMLAPTGGGRQVDARAATMADALGQQFFEKTGIRVGINDVNDSPGTSGKRRGASDPNDNPHVGNSQHLHGKAFDFQIQKLTPDQKKLFLQTARDIGFSGVGFYEGKSGHLHLDTGNARSWGGLPSWAGAGIPTLGQGSQAVGGSLGGLPLPPSMQQQAGGGDGVARRMQTAVPSNQSVARSFLPTPLTPDARDLIGAPTPGIGAVPATGAGPSGTAPVSSAAPVGLPPALRNAIDLSADIDPAAIREAVASDPRLDTPGKLSAAKNYVERQIRAQEAGQKSALKTLRSAAIQHVQRGGSTDELDPDLYSALLEKDPKFVTDTLPGMEDRIAKRKDKTDPEAYRALTLMDGDQFGDLDLTAWRGRLSSAHYEMFSDRQKAARKETATDAGKWNALQSETAIATNALKAGGIFPDKDDADANKRSGMFYQRVEEERQAFQAANKRLWNAKEMQESVAHLMTPINGGDYTGKTQYLFEQGTPEQNAFRKRNEMAPVGYQGQNLAPAQKLDQVPPAQIQTLLDNHVAIMGKPPTPAQTIRYHNDAVSLETGRQPMPDGPERNEIIANLRKQFGASIQTDKSRAAELEAKIADMYSRKIRFLTTPQAAPAPTMPAIPYQ